MGSCMHPPSKGTDEFISGQQSVARWQDYECNGHKTLLCGTKSSGKTTIFRQMQRLKCEEMIEWNDDYLSNVRRKCIDTIIYLLSLVHDTSSSSHKLQSLSIHRDCDLEKIGNIIHSVWTKYNGFQRILFYSFAYKDEFDFNPNTAYFMDNIQRIMRNETNPVLNDEDIVRFQVNCRQTGHGMSRFRYESEKQMKTKANVVMDLQSDTWSSDAKHWNLLDDVHFYKNRWIEYHSETIVFVAALSDYCETVPGHPEVNALKHSKDEFESIMSAEWNQKKLRVLLLNKKDIFTQRIRAGISLSVCFGDEYEGPNFPNTERNEDIRCVSDGLKRRMEIVLRRFIPNLIAETIYEYAKETQIGNHPTLDPVKEGMEFVKSKFIANFIRCRPFIYTHFICALGEKYMREVLKDLILMQTSALEYKEMFGVEMGLM